jgi:serine kinase of HPr protein (carbohydrate metabolism regulator)
MLSMMYCGKIYESDYHLRLRARKVKKIIEEYRKSYNKIIIISHHYMIQNLLARGYRKNHEPIITTQD